MGSDGYSTADREAICRFLATPEPPVIGWIVRRKDLENEIDRLVEHGIAIARQAQAREEES